MTPSVKKLLGSRLSIEEAQKTVKKLQREGFDFAKGSDSVLAENLIVISEFDLEKLDELLIERKENNIRLMKKVNLYGYWRNIERDYAAREPKYYKELVPSIIGIAHIAVSHNLIGCSSHGTLCMSDKDDKEFNPVLYVVPLIEGGCFITREHEAIRMAKLPTIVDEIKGKIVSYDNLCHEIEAMLPEYRGDTDNLIT